MPKSSAVIEIHQPLSGEGIDVSQLRTRALKRQYIRISQSHVLANIDSSALTDQTDPPVGMTALLMGPDFS